MNAFPRILLIDDDVFWSETLAECLRRRGFTVVEANDPFEALELMDQVEISLVISDYNLPGMNGLHLVRRLRQKQGNVAIIILSSEDEPTLSRRAVAAGALAFLEKTIAPGHLLRKIRQVLSTLLVKKLTAPSLQLWQRLLPNPHRNGQQAGNHSPANNSKNGTTKKALKTPA